MFSSSLRTTDGHSGDGIDLVTRRAFLRQMPDGAHERFVVGAARRSADARTELGRFGQPITHVRLIETGAASRLGRLADGLTGELGVAGPGSLIGAAEVLLGTNAICGTTTLSDCTYREVGVAAFRAMLDEEPDLREVVQRQTADLMKELVQASICHSRHSLLQRLAAWIEAADGHLGGGTLRTTHKEIASLLCARRATVTELLHILEGNSAIRSRRGSIVVRDRAALSQAACACRRPHA